MGFALNAVYNNYLTTYAPKPLTQYDTHKKSELRGVYNSIVKMNKDAPWYLPTTSKETQNYAVDIKENARELHNTIAQLGGLEEAGLLSKKRAFSSDENIAAASYIGSGETEAGLELEVRSLASPQENLGLFLPDEKVALPPNTYSFDISVNDMNYEFQFTIGEDETNRNVQERLSRLINNSGIGIHAELAESEGKTSLRLTSEATGLPAGKTNLFSVTDDRTSKSPGTVNYFGLNYTSHEASNAAFLVNGEERTALSNHFTIGQQFEVELKGISEEGKSTHIGLKTDVESLADNVSLLVGGFNDFIRAASSYTETQSKSGQLISELAGIAHVYENSLEPLGINLTENGTLKLDKNLLQQTAQDSENISEAFGSLRDFSSSLMRKSNQISINPMKYVHKTVVAYKNTTKNYVSPYTTSAYSGMMFNSYC